MTISHLASLFSYAACDQGNFEVAQLLLDRGYPIHEEQEWILLSPPQKLLDNDVSAGVCHTF